MNVPRYNSGRVWPRCLALALLLSLLWREG